MPTSARNHETRLITGRTGWDIGLAGDGGTYVGWTTTAAQVLTAVSTRAEVVDLAVEEPDVEDVVRRVYAARR